jgi:uncharacterized protein
VSLRLDDVEAIDFHVHAEASAGHEPDETTREYWEAASKYFRASVQKPHLDQIADYYRAQNLVAVVFPVDSTAGTGQVPVPNDEVLDAAGRHADVLVPFVSIDPHRGRAGLKEMDRLIERGAKGFKFHPNLQAFFPNDRNLMYAFYERIQGAGLVALFHTGHSGIGSGLPGGGGIRLKYSNPMYVDDVAVDFPDLTIILAHPSFPWQDEAISMAMHKTSIHIDLSGWSPKYFPPQLVQYINTTISDRVLFGSDYPLISPERWIADLPKSGIREDHFEKILKGNAMRLLEPLFTQPAVVSPGDADGRVNRPTRLIGTEGTVDHP